MKRYVVTVVPHTHWDREWYQPFAVFQARLVEAVDRALDLLEGDDDYAHFMLDGQAVVIEDYLAVRPEATERMRRLVEQGRLAIGPWYTLADEFLVSPEALVRNLLIGERVCRRLGTPMRVAYTPDSFGHISQLPLLAAGFGFDSLVFERGVGDEGERLRGEFRWFGADGRTSVLAVHLITTYSSGAALGYDDWEGYRNYDPERAVAHVDKVLHGGSEPVGMAEWLDDSLARIEGGAKAYASGSHLLLLNGTDHLLPQRNLPETIALLERRYPDLDFRIAGLRHFIDGVLGEDPKLPEYAGEFRGSRYHHVLSGVFSARMYLKQANHRSQLWLERYAEPLLAIATLSGMPYPHAVLEHNWKELLKNHCHDSICGCSIDQVHDEMMPRFRGVDSAARHLSRQAFASLTGGAWWSPPAPLVGDLLRPPAGADAVTLTVFNPHPWTWRGAVAASAVVPADSAPDSLLAPSGEPAQARLELAEFPFPGDRHRRERVATVAWLAELAPLSLTSYRLAEGAEGAPVIELPAGQEVRAHGRILENGVIRAEWTGERLNLTDAGSGRRVEVRLLLEDVADAGDEYDFSPVPGADTLRLPITPGGPAAGGLTGEFRFAADFPLPARLNEDRSDREGRVDVPIRIRASLSAADPYLTLDLEVDNQALDHRLQLVVECDVVAERLAVEGHFDVLERPLRVEDAPHWFQRPSGTEHQRRFLSVSDGERGLAVLNEGLPEYSAGTAEGGSRLAVTLLRSVGWLSRNDLISRPQGAGPALPTPGAQCLGDHRFRLALMPIAGDLHAAGVPAAAERFTVPPLVEATAGAASGRGLLEIPPGLLLSALKATESGEGLLVRLWNPGTERVQGELRLAETPTRIRRADLNERPVEELPVGDEIPLSVAPREVVTLLLQFGGEEMT